MGDFEAGFYEAHCRDHPADKSAYFQITGDGQAVLVYPSGEVHRGPAARILITEDLVKHSRTSIEKVDRDETPFADRVDPIEPEGEAHA